MRHLNGWSRTSFILFLIFKHVTAYLGVKGPENGAFRGFYVNRLIHPNDGCFGFRNWQTAKFAYVLLPPPLAYSNAPLASQMLLSSAKRLADLVSRRSILDPKPDVLILVPQYSNIHAALAPSFERNGLLRATARASIHLSSHPPLRPRLVAAAGPADPPGLLSLNRTDRGFSLFPLAVYGLTQYSAVVAMHPGAKVLGLPDMLFKCRKAFMFSSGRNSVMSDTLFTARPSLRTFNDMVAAAKEPEAFSRTTGWFGKGYVCREAGGVLSEHTMRLMGNGTCSGGRLLVQGMDGPLGFLWAYWTFRAALRKSAALCPCIFAYDQGYMCNAQSFAKTLVLRQEGDLDNCGAPGRLRSEGCHALPLLSSLKTHERAVETDFTCRPTFFIIGVRKGGTTDLYVRLTKHPQVVRNSAWYLDKSNTKRQAQTGETFYFQNKFASSEDFPAEDLPRLRSIQERKFPNCCDASKGEITGESTVSYLAAARLPEVMQRLCPESSQRFRLIVLLREPIERAASLHQMRVRLGCAGDQSSGNCTGVVERLGGQLRELRRRMDVSRGDRTIESWMWEGRAIFDMGFNNMLYEGLYALQLSRWLRYFPRNQIMLICSETLWNATRRSQELDKVQQFLSLEPHDAVKSASGEEQPVNSGKKFVYDQKHVLSRDDGFYKELVEFHAPWNRVLKEEFGATCSWLD